MYGTLSLCSMLLRSYRRSDAFYFNAKFSCSITITHRRADNAINLPPVALVMAYGDEIVADIVCSLHWHDKAGVITVTKVGNEQAEIRGIVCMKTLRSGKAKVADQKESCYTHRAFPGPNCRL